MLIQRPFCRPGNDRAATVAHHLVALVHLVTQRDRLAVDLDPALFDPAFDFTAGAEAKP